MAVERSGLRHTSLALAGVSTLVALLTQSASSPNLQPHFGYATASKVQGSEKPPTQNNRSVASSPISSATQIEVDEVDCQHLPNDHPLRARLNGPRLPLRYEELEEREVSSLLEQAKVIPLRDNRLLVGLGNTLYMLDSMERVSWTYTPTWILWDFAVVESTGLIYGGAGDGVMFILDLSTGRPLYSHFQNGKANHLQVASFGKDMCLMTDSMAGYREALDEWATDQTEFVEPDILTAWRGTEVVWSVDFPPDADLVVRGDKIFAVTKTDKHIYVRKIVPPKRG